MDPRAAYVCFMTDVRSHLDSAGLSSLIEGSPSLTFTSICVAQKQLLRATGRDTVDGPGQDSVEPGSRHVRRLPWAVEAVDAAQARTSSVGPWLRIELCRDDVAERCGWIRSLQRSRCRGPSAMPALVPILAQVIGWEGKERLYQSVRIGGVGTNLGAVLGGPKSVLGLHDRCDSFPEGFVRDL